MTLEEMKELYEQLEPLKQEGNWEQEFLEIVYNNLLKIEKSMFIIEKVFKVVFSRHEDSISELFERKEDDK